MGHFRLRLKFKNKNKLIYIINIKFLIKIDLLFVPYHSVGVQLNTTQYKAVQAEGRSLADC